MPSPTNESLPSVQHHQADSQPGENYSLPRDEVEKQRLQIQSNFAKKVIGHLHVPGFSVSDANVTAILDAGTGSTTWLQAMSSELPSQTQCELHGVDFSNQLFPNPPITREGYNLHLRQHNLTEPFPAEFHGKFDLVNGRALVMWLEGAYWETVLRNLFDVLKPGGGIQLYEALHSVDDREGVPFATKRAQLAGLRYFEIMFGHNPSDRKALPNVMGDIGYVDAQNKFPSYRIGGPRAESSDLDIYDAGLNMSRMSLANSKKGHFEAYEKDPKAWKAPYKGVDYHLPTNDKEYASFADEVFTTIQKEGRDCFSIITIARKAV